MLLPVTPTDRENDFLIALLVRLTGVEHRLWEHEDIVNTDFVALDYVDLIMDFIGVPADEEAVTSESFLGVDSPDLRHSLLGLFQQIDDESSATDFIQACREAAQLP